MHTPPPAQLDVRTNTNFEIIGHPGGSTIDAQGLSGGTTSRIFALDYLAALTLKNVTLINGRATDGGAIWLRSRLPPGLEISAMTFNQAEASRLTILGGAIRDCEATNDGGAIVALAEASILGSAVGRAGPLVVPSSA